MKPDYLLPAFVLLLLTASSHAQRFSVEWSSLNGGGGKTESGGRFSVQATVGQPSASPSESGRFAVLSGYWAVVTVTPTEGAPPLSVRRDGASGAVTVFWQTDSDGWVLQTSPTLGQSPAPWTEVPAGDIQSDATHRFITISSPTGTRFYRLAKP